MNQVKVKTVEAAQGGAAVAVAAFEPSQAVRELLAKHNVSIYPPNTSVGDKSIEWRGRGYVLPNDPSEVSLEDAAKALKAKADEEKQPVRVYEQIDCMPWDGAQAFQKAIEFLFGWGISRPTPGFFGPNPPVLRSIKTGPEVNDTIQVFWGAVEIPQLGCTLNTSIDYKDDRIVFCVGGTIPRGKRHHLETLVALTRIFANEQSIYKGKAIRMFVNEAGELDFDREPEFIKTDIGLMDKLIFTDNTRSQVETNLFAPIRYSEVCRQMGIPLKRGVLFEGPYGTGKSMTAAATAALAVQNGWTFIMVNRVSGLKSVLDFAHRYAPVVVFAEDIDRVVEGHERTVSIDDILNTLDGVQSKKHDIITVLTSNHANKINRAMLRPGRLDAIISVELPDGAAAEKLMRQYGGSLIPESTDLSRSREALAGRIPAVIREAVERAKLSAIARTGGVPRDLTDDDMFTAALTMQTHLDLLYSKEDEPKTPEQALGEALLGAIRNGVSNNSLFDSLKHQVNVAAAHAEAANRGVHGLVTPVKETHQKVMTTKATPQ